MKKNWSLLVLSLIVILTTAVSSQIELGELPGSQQLVDTIQSLVTKLSFLVGGIFGLYAIIVIVQIYNEQKKVRLLRDIRNDLDLLTKHFGVKHSHEKRGLFRRLFGFLLPEDEDEKGKK